MTANLVNGLGSTQNLIPPPAAPGGSSAGTDFSKVLDTSSAKETSKSQNGTENRDDRLNQTDKAEKVNKTEDKQEVRDNKTDKTEKDSTVSKKDKAEDKSQVAEDTTPDEKDMEQIAEVVVTMVQTIAEVLEIPATEVAEAIDALGLEEMELLDSKNIPALVTEITGAEDAAAIVTDEELFADVKELMETSDKLVTELATELKVPVEEVKTIISEKAKETNDENVTVQSENPELTVDIKVEEEVATRNEKQGGNKQGTSDNRQTGQTVNFGQTVVDTLKASVEEVINDMPVSYSTASVEDILEQVTDTLKTTMKEDITEMEMQLHPASLGNIKIQVAARDGVITANFTTQNEEVRQALETQIIQLKEQMNEQGIKVEAVEVTVNAHAFERSFNNEQDQSNGQNETEAKKRRVRGINLSGMDMNDLDEIDEEDKVTADMMAKQGNTVDYLA